MRSILLIVKLIYRRRLFYIFVVWYFYLTIVLVIYICSTYFTVVFYRQFCCSFDRFWFGSPPPPSVVSTLLTFLFRHLKSSSALFSFSQILLTMQRLYAILENFVYGGCTIIQENFTCWISLFSQKADLLYVKVETK